MYKFGISSRFVKKLKSEDAVLLEETEKNDHSLQSKSLRRGQYRGDRDIPPPWFKAKSWRYFKLGANSSLPNFIYRKTRNVSETPQ